MCTQGSECTDRLPLLSKVSSGQHHSISFCLLNNAIIFRYYLLSLAQGDENNLSIFRVISLWLENPTLQFDEVEESSFEELLFAVPTRKYLPVLPQLAPRLTTDNNTFDKYLHNILSKFLFEYYIKKKTRKDYFMYTRVID